ncbi:MAG: MBL fold metallo-hydrolase [Candidatus Thorarchaeota archaeon]|jgi:ribonuclease BN (tRNA processing enzyme)
MIEMRAVLLGTGTSYPDPSRVQSGILVEDGNHRILIDIGSGVLHRLTQLEIDIRTIDSVFISHFHIDHCSDFLPLCQSLWLSGYDKTLNLFAPPTVKEWSRGVFDVAFKYLRDKLLIKTTELNENHVIPEGNLTVIAGPTLHGNYDTRGFRVEHGEKILTYSSDTAPCRDIIDLAKGTDVLVHECNWLDGPHPEGVHTSPSELAKIAEEINPSKIVLTHISPEVDANKDKVIEIVSRRTNAEVLLGEDLMVLDL